MQTQTPTTASKMITRFDKELKKLLLNDLSAVRSKSNLAHAIQNQLNSRLSAA